MWVWMSTVIGAEPEDCEVVAVEEDGSGWSAEILWWWPMMQSIDTNGAGLRKEGILWE